MTQPAFNPRNALCRRLGIDLPIFGFSHEIDVIVALTRAGGYGVYGVAREDPAQIPARIAQLRAALGNRPFGVDLMLPAGMPERADPQAVAAQIPDGHRAFVERLAAGLLAWMRMKNPHADAAVAGDTLAWARRQLQPIDRHPPAVRLVHLLETAAQARGAGAAAG